MPRPAYEPAHCVVCGHSVADVVAEHDDVRDEIELLWEYQGRRLRADTPTERLADRVTFSQHPPYRLVRCVECGLVYRNPAERDARVTAIYAGESAPPTVLGSLRANQLETSRQQARTLRRVLGRTGSGLEVGSYVGAFLGASREEGFDFEGLDVNAGVNAFTRGLGFTVHDGTLASLPAGHTFDCVAIWNTFDQLADPRAAVHGARALLRTNGVLALRVPNGRFYAAQRRRLKDHGRFRRSIARSLLAQNNLLGFPYRWGFTLASLSRLLGAAGLTISHVRGDALVRTSDEWTRRWARAEERVVKSAMALVASRGAAWAPWVEVYATRR